MLKLQIYMVLVSFVIQCMGKALSTSTWIYLFYTGVFKFVHLHNGCYTFIKTEKMDVDDTRLGKRSKSNNQWVPGCYCVFYSNVNFD